MFESTHEFGFFEYFRVPYHLVDGKPSDGEFGRLWRTDNSGRTLEWPLAQGIPADVRPARCTMDGKQFVARLVPEAVLRERLAASGREWRRHVDLLDLDGERVGSVWRDDAGSVVLPFDPAEVLQLFWSEGYQDAGSDGGLGRTARDMLLRVYYALRPVIPRPAQIAMRRVFTRVQEKVSFPDWPIEPALHDFFDWCFDLVVELADGPVPWLDVWPDGKSWALVLTHDVETEVGRQHRHLLRDLEREHGLVSSWNFVPLRYDVADAEVRAIQDEGCEVGVHGLKHDGKDFGSLRLLKRRLPAMAKYARRWNAVGFRSPATHRVWAWMPLLASDAGFEYDSSYHDTAPHEPRPGGACSYFPYVIRPVAEGAELVELPITLPQDHTVFTILRHDDGQVWLDKAADVRARGGMALVLTHPDYAAADQRVVDGYRALLESYGNDATAWHALPRDVAAWWRRRAASGIEQDETGLGWRVTGPAVAEARVRLAHKGTGEDVNPLHTERQPDVTY